MAITSPDDRVQVEEQAMSSNAVELIRVQNDQIPANNIVGSGPESIPKSTVARAPRCPLVIARHVYVQRPHFQLLPIRILSLPVQRFMNLTSSYGPANLQLISAPHSRPKYQRVCLVPDERDDGDISEEMSNAVAAVEAADDIPAGHTKVRVTVQNTCPIVDCRSKNYVRFMTIVCPEDAPTRLSETTTAYFICDRHDCDITFELEEIWRTARMISHIFLVPYATTLWRRVSCSAAGFGRGSHVNRVVVNTKEENPASDTVRLDRLELDIG